MSFPKASIFLVYAQFHSTQNSNDAAEDDEDDGGGLMGAISKAAVAPAPAKKEKKSKKKNKPDYADLDDQLDSPVNGVVDEEGASTPKSGPIAVSADDWLDSEFGETKKGKGKKAKGGKKQTAVAQEDDIPEETVSVTQAAQESPVTPIAQAEPTADDDEEPEDKSAKPLSKKEKEKLKKQRQKVYLVQCC